MIKEISWEEILKIWANDLWPDRKSSIERNSAMVYLAGYNSYNMTTSASFFGYIVGDKIVGVNSGHSCADSMYRSRGLWVNKDYRGKGIGQKLLLKTIDRALEENAHMIWSLPRYTSWNTYRAVGFELASKWHITETSEKNAYCVRLLK